MTAHLDISAALKALPAVERGKQRFVLAGEPCMRALAAAMDERDTYPTHIGGVPIVRTNEFKGWEVVDRRSAMVGFDKGKPCRELA